MEDSKVYTIRKCEDLMCAVRLMNEKHDGFDVWWRGESCSTWPLLPGAFRPGRHPQYERNVLDRFILAAPSRHVKSPPYDDKPSWTFLAQHYGLPTRILDWSESILIASFFAVDDRAKDDQNGVLWALLPFNLNKFSPSIKGIANERCSNVIDVLKAAFDEGPKKEVVIATVTAELDLRMSSQHARFTVHGTRTPLDEITFEKPILQKFIIPSENKAELRKELSLLGTTRSTLFPDLQNLALELTSFWEDGVPDGYFGQI